MANPVPYKHYKNNQTVSPYISVLTDLFSMVKDSLKCSDIAKYPMVWAIIQAICHNETVSHVTNDIPVYLLVS